MIKFTTKSAIDKARLKIPLFVYYSGDKDEKDSNFANFDDTMNRDFSKKIYKKDLEKFTYIKETDFKVLQDGNRPSPKGMKALADWLGQFMPAK